jgi:flagellar motor switch protein FliN/FliY
VSAALIESICTHFVGAVATLLGLAASPGSGAEPPMEGWRIRIELEGRGAGTLWIGLAEHDAVSISRRILGVDADPAEDAIRDTLRELATQAVGRVVLLPLARDLVMSVAGVVPTVEGIGGDRAGAWTYTLGDGLSLVVAAWSAPAIDEQPRPTLPKSVASVSRASSGADNLDLVLDIDLPMSVRFGQTELTLGALIRLGPGSVIDLGRSPEDPVDVLVSGRVVARGGVVVVGGNYGVRITEVAGPTGGHRD